MGGSATRPAPGIARISNTFSELCSEREKPATRRIKRHGEENQARRCSRGRFDSGYFEGFVGRPAKAQRADVLSGQAGVSGAPCGADVRAGVGCGRTAPLPAPLRAARALPVQRPGAVEKEWGAARLTRDTRLTICDQGSDWIARFAPMMAD